ncbi:Variant surface glycoprotein [Trypanosoma congolense IL3000]|uniref:Variant surface glycoprotein n=1 Tax=Trypanosoma congolense (strain IL3000) TaxID=1068625 RepID=F9W9C0_TRYCI|nr:Variant surface glycoprotein [Trypanosoma congolense IL3000]
MEVVEKWLKMRENFFLSVLLSHISVKMAVGHTVGDNTDVRNLLCDALKAGLAVQRSVNGEVNTTLREAIYGNRSRGLFGEGGEVTLPWSCGSGGNGRGVVCDYNGGGGCFVESLLGTFFCSCTPGYRIAGSEELCGVRDWGEGEMWLGWVVGDGTKYLFKKVWNSVIQRCYDGEEIGGDDTNHIKRLGEALQSVENNLRQSESFFYLGGSGNSGCSGVRGNDICARYKKNPRSNKAEIPWVDKFRKAISILEEERTRESSRITTRVASNSNKAVVAKGVTVLNEHTAHDTKGKINESEHSTSRGRTSINSEDKATERTEVSPKTSSNIDIANIENDLKEDGLLITQPLWLPLAALFN